jgi:hypothetical protein
MFWRRQSKRHEAFIHTHKTPHLPSYKMTLLHYLQFSGKRLYRKRLTLCAIIRQPPISEIVNWEAGRRGILSNIQANWVNGIGSLSKYSFWMVQNSIHFKIIIINWEYDITAGNLKRLLEFNGSLPVSYNLDFLSLKSSPFKHIALRGISKKFLCHNHQIVNLKQSW